MRGAALDEAIATSSRRSSRTSVSAATRRSSSGPSASTALVPTGFGSRPSGSRRAVVDEDVLEAMRRMIAAVRTFSEAQRPADTTVEAAPGIVSERRWVPIDAVGICVPSGRPAAVVARDDRGARAGGRRPAHRGRDAEPGRCDARRRARAGLDEIYAVGGAQAVAALAYGTETIAPVDKIVGPGNAYVTAAKLLVSSRVGIDLPAGPSEVVVIADATRGPGPRARPICSPRPSTGTTGRRSCSRRSQRWPPRSRRCCANDNVRVELVESLDEALVRSEAYAPEHLELHVADPEALLGRVRNAGTVFVGELLGGRRLRGGRDARAADRRARASIRRPRARDVPQAVADRACERRRAAAAAAVVGPLARVEGLPLHAAAPSARGGHDATRPGAARGPRAFAAAIRRASAPTVDEVAARHGLDPGESSEVRPEHAAAAGVPQVPLAESMARSTSIRTGRTASCARRRRRTSAVRDSRRRSSSARARTI